MAGSCGEAFCRWGGGDSLWGAASRLLGGWEAFRGYASHKCRLIPPHQSLARQTACSFLSPEGKPSICCANMANMALHCGLPLRSALIILSCSAKRLSQKGFPSGGSWRRRRLMRGDQSPPAQCLQTLAPPPTKKARSRTLQKIRASQSNQKTSPKSTRAMQSETTLCHEKAGALGGSSR